MRRVLCMLLPVLAVIGGFFAGGLALALVQSLGFYTPTGEQAFTLTHYSMLWRDVEFQASLSLTFALATIATSLSMAAGLSLALALRDLARRTHLWNLLLQVPLAVPHLVMAVLVIQVLSPSGLISRLAHAAGLVGAPAGFPVWVQDRYGVGIVLGYVLKETPFVALMILAVLLRIGDDYELAARTLGATPWQRLRHVTIPLVAPAAVPAALVVFAFIFGAFEMPFLLGRPYPAMLAVVAQRRFLSVDLAERPDAIAVAVVIAVIATLLVWLYLRAARAFVGLDRPTIF